MTDSSGATPSASSAAMKIEGWGLIRPCDFEPIFASTSSAVVDDELVEVALPVRDKPDPEPMPPQLLEDGQRILVQGEVLVTLPLAHHVHGARPRTGRAPAHSEDDLLREGDPDLLVVHQVALARQRLDRVDPSLRVALGVELEAVPLADAPVPLRPELRPGAKEREVDVEQDSPQHRSRITRSMPALDRRSGRRVARREAWTKRPVALPTQTAAPAASRYDVAPRGVAQPGSALRSGRRGPQFKSGHPDVRRGGNPRFSPRVPSLDSGQPRSPASGEGRCGPPAGLSMLRA